VTSRVLTLFDCICIIVGTIIGAGIFAVPAIVSANVASAYWLAAVWIFGGFIALIGALCFAELTTTYPDLGGDYGYLKRAYHRRVGFHQPA
jgi:APA family basic amino acid/polyamine antiporter